MRMWKNIKIRFKLLLGFGLLLVVFLAAVAVTWSHLNAVRDSEELAEAIIAVMREISTLERNANEYLSAFRQMQYAQTEESFSYVKEKEIIVQKDIDIILASGAANSSLQAPKYVQDKFVPRYKEFVEAVDKAITDLRKKKEHDLAAGVYGNEISKYVSEIGASYSRTTTDSLTARDPYAVTIDYLNHFREIMSIAVEIQTVRRNMMKATATNDSDAMDEAHKALPNLEKGLTVLRDASNDAERTALLNQAIQATQNYRISLGNMKKVHIDFEKQNNICNSLEQILNDESSNASNLARGRVEKISAETIDEVTNVIEVLSLSAVISVILGVLAAFSISHSISKPLQNIVNLAGRAGEGDLTIKREEFRYEGKDETGKLADAISNMIAKQEESMNKVMNVVGSLSMNAGNLSAISEETNASMGEIKDSIERVAFLSENNSSSLAECNAGIEEVSAGAHTVAERATESAEFIAHTNNVSNGAIRTVDNVISGMRNVNLNAKESENKTRQLVSSVENVTSFVTVITGIADQTNLLALNAAIEAARAGDVGRGFAVVAEEVRKLAEDSAKAAQNVNSIILELQDKAQESIKATSEAGRLLVETLAQAELAQTELSDALQEMQKANDSIQNIAAISEEQAASSREVANSIDKATVSTAETMENLSNIRKATENTAETSHDMAELAESVNERSKELAEVLSHFTIDAPALTALPFASQ